jgi:hypothetical protein
VRAAVHRTIGEMIIQGILSILNDSHYNDDSMMDVLMFSSKCLDTSLRDGCSDTSLAVRLQAVWALGNLILVYIYIYMYFCVYIPYTISIILHYTPTV